MSVLNFPAPRFPGVPRQGTFYEWPAPGRYVLVVSNDDHNDGFHPHCVPIVRTAPAGPYLVALADADPIGGRLHVHLLTPVPRGELTQEAGMITGSTWDRLAEAIHLLYSISDGPRP